MSAQENGKTRNKHRTAVAVAGAFLIGVVATKIYMIMHAGIEGSPGFFGPGPLIADINLALEILLVAGLTFGFYLARSGSIDAHQANQTIWVLLNVVLVLFIMLGSMQDVKPARLADFSEARIAVTWLHAAIGALTALGGVWLVLQMNGVLPKSWHIKWWKNLMRATLAGYWAVALLGFATYYFWYVA